MDSTLDVIGSFILFGVLLLAILTMNTNMALSSIETYITLMNQQNVETLMQIFDNDFPKAGYGADKPRLQPGKCGPAEIVWSADINDNGIVDTVRYFWGPDTIGTANPNDFLLYRQVVEDTTWTRTQMMNLGVVSLNFIYYDSLLAPIDYSLLNTSAGVNRVKGVDVQLTLQSQEQIGAVYPEAILHRTYFPTNLRLN